MFWLQLACVFWGVQIFFTIMKLISNIGEHKTKEEFFLHLIPLYFLYKRIKELD